jgi:hypothetical protein
MRHCHHARCERIWTDHGNILISTLSDDPLAIAHCNQAIPTQTYWHYYLLEKSRSWNTTWQTNTDWNKWQYLAEDSETAQTGIKHYVAKSDYAEKFLHAFHIHNPCKLGQFAWRYYECTLHDELILCAWELQQWTLTLLDNTAAHNRFIICLAHT